MAQSAGCENNIKWPIPMESQHRASNQSSGRTQKNTESMARTVPGVYLTGIRTKYRTDDNETRNERTEIL